MWVGTNVKGQCSSATPEGRTQTARRGHSPGGGSEWRAAARRGEARGLGRRRAKGAVWLTALRKPCACPVWHGDAKALVGSDLLHADMGARLVGKHASGVYYRLPGQCARHPLPPNGAREQMYLVHATAQRERPCIIDMQADRRSKSHCRLAVAPALGRARLHSQGRFFFPPWRAVFVESR